jgi:signal transduction histidine kinase
VFENQPGGVPIGAVLVHYGSEPELEANLAEMLGVSGRSLSSSDGSLLEKTLNPLVERIAKALLLERRGGAEAAAEAYKLSVSDGLNKVIKAAPLETLMIVDDERRIQYVNDPRALDLTFTDPEFAALFASNAPVRQRTQLATGEPGIEVMLPVFDLASTEDTDTDVERRRLGSLLIRFRPDPGLVDRIPGISQPRILLRDYLQPLTLFLVVAVGGGILLAALTGLPVRRVERALKDFRDRGFKGHLDPHQGGLPRELASAVQTISELGGRLEALDAEGREREALLATLSQTLEDGMVALDPTGQPVAWNPAALRMLIGEPGLVDDDRSEVDLLAESLDRNSDLEFALAKEAFIGTTREVELCHADGRRAIARMTQHPVELGPGVTGTLLFFRDLGALRKVETHLLDAGRYASLAHLAAGLAHEIRNPLHAIQLNASVVEQYTNDPQMEDGSRAVSESLTVIQEEARRLTDLLNNYLGMLRPGDEAGPVDLGDLCQRVIQLVAYAARRSHVEIRLRSDDSEPVVYGVSDRLQQAILNLVLNAIHAMPDGGTITLQTSTYAETVRVTVSDTGPGLPQELADQLFDTRVTTKREGSGLGLPLVRLIAEAHGGGVWYRSRPGAGATFTLVFPRPE